MADNKGNSYKMKAGPVVGSYANIFKPRAINEKSDPKYSISLLFPKNADPLSLVGRNFAELKSNCERLAAIKFGPNWKKIPFFKFGIRDGDVEKPDHKEYAGQWFFNVSSKRPVGIIDRKRQPVLSEAEAFSGCIFVASINLYAYDKDGGKGVTGGLNNLMVWAKGERIDGRLDAGDDFAEYEGGPGFGVGSPADDPAENPLD